MCKGAREAKEGDDGFRRTFKPEEGIIIASSHEGTRRDFLIRCELCSSRAVLYCQADDAYLCKECDKRVHRANFLALRHIRCFLCNTCQNMTQRYLIGASTIVLLPTIVSRQERDLLERKSSKMLKRPFLLL